MNRSVAIFCETRNGVRPISGAKNQATAMAFGGPRSSCVRPGAHSARRQDSRNDLTPYRMALHFVSAGAHAPHSDTATRGSSHSARRLRSLAFLCSSNALYGLARPENPSMVARRPKISFRCSPIGYCPSHARNMGIFCASSDWTKDRMTPWISYHEAVV